MLWYDFLIKCHFILFIYFLHYCCCPLICISPATGWKKMELKFGQSCSGAVFIHSEGKTSAISSDSWTEKEGSRLCQDLGCGAFKSNRTKRTNDPFWNNSFHCEGDPKTIWECEKSRLPAHDQQLVIECQGTFFFFEFLHIFCQKPRLVFFTSHCKS